LRTQAGQDARRHVAAPFVAVARPGEAAVLGYFTLSAFGVELGALPETVTRKLPRYPVMPATMLGRLAVDERHRGKGLEELLLMAALRRAWEQAAGIAAAVVVVDAIDSEAVRFYRHFDFLPMPEREDRLFLPMGVVGGLLR
jgi:GNAT superfamily N-acetyltransferase